MFHTRKLLCSGRNLLVFHQKSFSIAAEQKWEEVRIPVPWGHIAGKWWGSQDKRPILCLHGWQESCASFDRLINQLPKNSSYLTIDYPGHGFSSHMPKGCYYYTMDSVILLRMLQKYFAWPKMSFLCHSIGSSFAFLYTGLYPNDVDLLIGIDGVKPIAKTATHSIESTAKNIDKFLFYVQMDQNESEPPVYTKDELVEKIHLASLKSITPEMCGYIIERMIRPSAKEPNKYYVARDVRVKLSALLGTHQSDFVELAKRITCPMLTIKMENSTYFGEKENYIQIMNVLKSHNKNYELVYLDATHHTHIIDPEKIANIITPFLEKHYKQIDNSIGIKKEIILRN